MTAIVTRGDAGNLHMPDATVDLIVTSPPYFGLRSYQDGGEHYAEQIGAEATPTEYLDALMACTAEWMRVLKPGGSIFINLGDKYAADNRGSGGDKKRGPAKWAPSGKAGYAGEGFVRQKSLMMLPQRYAIRCIDELGLILRAEIVWAKPNGLPESVTDRVRRSHEQVFHFVKQPRYFSAVDEVREESSTAPRYEHRASGRAVPGLPVQSNLGAGGSHLTAANYNPLGKLPGSVWTIPTSPLRVPDWRGVEAGRIVRYFAGRTSRADADAWLRAGGALRRSVRPMADHFAAMPPELARRAILGWSPREVCSECGEGRRPVVASVGLDISRPQARRAQELAEAAGLTEEHMRALLSVGVSDTGRGKATQSGTGKNTPEVYALADEARGVLGGYSREYLLRRPTSFASACACPDNSAPSAPGIVLDPFGGTGTTALVASVFGRVGISNDLSDDYGRLARWRTTDEKQRAKAAGVKPKAPKKAAPVADVIALPGQLDLTIEGEWTA